MNLLRILGFFPFLSVLGSSSFATGCLIWDFFPFRLFSVYLVIFCVDLGPGTFVMGNFGIFLGILGLPSLTGKFWRH